MNLKVQYNYSQIRWTNLTYLNLTIRRYFYLCSVRKLN